MGADVIKVRLANFNAGASAPEAFVRETIEIEHGHVWRILGKDGELIRQLELDTGASLTFEREKVPTSEGVDELHIMGRKDQVDVTRRVLQRRLDDLLTSKFGIEPPFAPEATREIPVEQQFIGWIMGKSKEKIREIADQSGASIIVKQTTKNAGHSVIKIAGGQAATDAAYARIQQRIDQGRRYQDDKRSQFLAGDWLCPGCGDQNFRRNEACRRCNASKPAGVAEGEGNDTKSGSSFLSRDCDDAFQVDQKYVGFIIGPGGANFREIKEKSGAKIFIDQETRDQGFSIVRIGNKGTPENLLARDLIEKKIEESLNAQSSKHAQQKAPIHPVHPVNPVQTGGVGACSKASGGPPQASQIPQPPPPPALPQQMAQTSMGMGTVQGNVNSGEGLPTSMGGAGTTQQWDSSQCDNSNWDMSKMMKWMMDCYASWDGSPDASWNSGACGDVGCSTNAGTNGTGKDEKGAGIILGCTDGTWSSCSEGSRQT